MDRASKAERTLRAARSATAVGVMVCLSGTMLPTPGLARSSAAASSVGPVFARLQVSDEQVIRVSLRVDALALGDYSGALTRNIENRANALFRAMDVLPARRPDDLILKVTVVQAVNAEGDPSYLSSFSAERNGEVIEDGVTRLECPLCTEGELIDKIAKHLELYLREEIERQRRAREAERAAAARAAEATSAPTGPSATREPPADASPRRLGPLGATGLGVGGLGLGSLALGATFVGIGSVPGDTAEWEIELGRPWGWIALSSGMALLAGGATMLIIDLVRGRRQAGSRTTAGGSHRRTVRPHMPLPGFRPTDDPASMRRWLRSRARVPRAF